MTAGTVLLVFVTGLTRVEVRRSHDSREIDFLRTTDVTLEDPAFRPVRKLQVDGQSGDGHGWIGTALVGGDELVGEAIQTFRVIQKGLETNLVERLGLEFDGREGDELICSHCVAKGY